MDNDKTKAIELIERLIKNLEETAPKGWELVVKGYRAEELGDLITASIFFVIAIASIYLPVAFHKRTMEEKYYSAEKDVFNVLTMVFSVLTIIIMLASIYSISTSIVNLNHIEGVAAKDLLTKGLN